MRNGVTRMDTSIAVGTATPYGAMAVPRNAVGMGLANGTDGGWT